MRLELLSEIPEDAELRRQWNELVRSVERPQVFYTHEWALAVYRAYRESLRPLLFLGYEGERLCGVAALAVNSAEHICFLCATTADYCDFLARPEQHKDFVFQVLAELRKRERRCITLTNLPADSVTVKVLQGASHENGFHLFARTAYECAQISLGELRAKSVGGQLEFPHKKVRRRALREMGREAPLRLEHIETAEAIAPVLDRFFESHVARFLATGRISNLARPERQIFLLDLARLLSQSGWLRLTRLVSGDRVYAWNYGFNFEGTWFWYQPTFDGDYEKLSPGFCLLTELVQEAAKTATVDVVDLGLGAEGYKEDLANSNRTTLYITLRASLAAHLQQLLRFHSSRAVQAFPKIERPIRRARERWQRMRAEGFAASCKVSASRLRHFVSSTAEVSFFSGRESGISNLDGTLRALDLKSLAAALMQNVGDEPTCTYLLRCAARLRTEGAQGFALLNHAGVFLNFAWVTGFEGFFVPELNIKLEAPSPEGVIFFDSWTPTKMRGHGYASQTVALMARLMRQQGKEPWIFGIGTSPVSIEGLEKKTGFQWRYSLVRKRFLGFQWVKAKTLKAGNTSVLEVSASL